MNKNLFNILFAASILTFTACDNPSRTAAGETVSVQHELGTAQVPVQPRRVVVFDVGTLETLDELHIPVAGIPKDYMAKHLEKYRKDPNVQDAGSIIQPNLERVNQIKPDLVVISAVTSREYEQLSKIAPTIYLGVKNENYMQSVIDNLNTIGDIFGVRDKTDQKVAEIERKIETAVKTISASPKKSMVLMYNAGAFSTFGNNSRYGFLYTDLKAVPADENKQAGVHGTVVSSEYISRVNPDILYIIDRNEIMLGEKTDKDEIENALIQKTNAFKNNRIIHVDPNVWYLSGGGTYSLNRMLDDVLKGYE
ncbi:siderophore ABC transporter substrate-binding protein [Sphingobacterium thalpophilum]|uniref:Siderophore ABC transporter substrate-binding protein n=1 Tax=Sphingobacterium thalpophilum TaxID=259 RepID=A0ABV4H9Q6_9SPHI